MIRPRRLASNAPLVWSPGTGNQVWDVLSAAHAGDLARLARTLDEHPALVHAQWHYRTPLHFAVREGHGPCVELLLARGAMYGNGPSPDSLLELARERGRAAVVALLERYLTTEFGYSADDRLHAAIRARDEAQVRGLLDGEPGLLHASDVRTNRPIHWATMTRQPALVDLLIERGADLEAQRADGARALQLHNGDYFFRGWRDVDKAQTPEPRAVQDHLLARGARLDPSTAAWRGDLAAVRAAVDADPAAVDRSTPYAGYYVCGGTPLFNAAAAGHLEIVELLLARGADPNRRAEGIAPRGHALYSAAANRHHAVARVLLAAGADPSAPVESSADALTRAMMNQDAEMIELLLRHGATRSVDVMAYYNDMQTAAAVFAVDPARADDEDAIGSAASEGHSTFVDLMLKYQPDLLGRVGCIGKTAAVSAHLFARGLDPNHRDWQHVTALHHLARRGDAEQTALWLARGADPRAVDEERGWTPRQYAEQAGHAAVAELLREAMSGIHD